MPFCVICVPFCVNSGLFIPDDIDRHLQNKKILVDKINSFKETLNSKYDLTKNDYNIYYEYWTELEKKLVEFIEKNPSLKSIYEKRSSVIYSIDKYTMCVGDLTFNKNKL